MPHKPEIIELSLGFVVAPEAPAYNPEVLESLTLKQIDPFTYYSSQVAATGGIERSPVWQIAKNKLLSPHQQLRELQERLGQEATAHVMVVGGGATATAAIEKLLEEKDGQNVIVVHIFDPEDLAGQTKKIEINIHNPARNQQNAAIAFSGPILSIGERLAEDEIGEIAKNLNVDFIIDARGLTAEDEKKLTDSAGNSLEYGLEHDTLVSREFIDLVHDAENELAQGNPDVIITLYNTLDLQNVVISGAGKVGTQDLVTKIRLLQVGQKLYRETGRLIDFQKFAEKEFNSFSVNLEKLGLNPADLGKITVVNRSLPRIIDSSIVHQADTYNRTRHDQSFGERRRTLYKEIARIENLPDGTANTLAADLVKNYYEQSIDNSHTNAYMPLVKKLKKESINLLKKLFDEEEIRKYSPKFREDTYSKLRKWQEEFGFDFVEGITPNHYDSQTNSIGFDNQHPDAPANATLLLSALGVNKYDYPDSWRHTPGEVAGMRAVGSGNISTSVQHVKQIIEDFLGNIEGRRKKTITQNRALLTNFEVMLSTYKEGGPLEGMVAHSPWLLIRDWLRDPITSSTLAEFTAELDTKIRGSLKWETHQLLTHIATKMSKLVPDSDFLKQLKNLSLDNIDFNTTTDRGHSYHEVIFRNLDLPFRFRIDGFGKLSLAYPTTDASSDRWIEVKSLRQLDIYIRNNGRILNNTRVIWSRKEEALLTRLNTVPNAVYEDNLDRFLKISLRKAGMTNQQLQRMDISQFRAKFKIKQGQVYYKEDIVTQTEFDHIIDQWHNKYKLESMGRSTVEAIKESLAEAKKYQVAAESILGFLSGSLLSLSGLDRDTVTAALTSSVALSGIANIITTTAHKLTKNSSTGVKKTINTIENVAQHAGLVAGWALLGFGLTEWINPSLNVATHTSNSHPGPTVKHAHGYTPIDPPLLETPLDPTPPTAVETSSLTPPPGLIPHNFSSMTDLELLTHIQTFLGENNWENPGPFHDYNGRPVTLADVIFKVIRFNQDSYTPTEVAATLQIAETKNLADLITLIRQGVYQTVFSN